MATVREFYEFLWEEVDQNSINHPDTPNNPVLTAEVNVTDRNLSFLKDCEDNSIFTVKNFESIDVGKTIEIERTNNNYSEDGVYFSFHDALRFPISNLVKQRKFYIGDINYDSVKCGVKSIPKKVLFLLLTTELVDILDATKDYGHGLLICI